MGYDKKKKERAKKNRQTKKLLVFDEKARKEFLTGFQKRKDERRKKAQEQVQRMLKEERKALKQKTKEFLEQRDKKRQPLPLDLEDIVSKNVTELPEHTVTITDISDIDLAGHGGTRLGLNTAAVEEEEVSNADSKTSDDEEDSVPEAKEVSIMKRDRDIRRIKEKIQKTSKHLKKKRNSKKKKTFSKKVKQKRKHRNDS